jgi:hypothetical protein
VADCKGVHPGQVPSLLVEATIAGQYRWTIHESLGMIHLRPQLVKPTRTERGDYARVAIDPPTKRQAIMHLAYPHLGTWEWLRRSGRHQLVLPLKVIQATSSALPSSPRRNLLQRPPNSPFPRSSTPLHRNKFPTNLPAIESTIVTRHENIFETTIGTPETTIETPETILGTTHGTTHEGTFRVGTTTEGTTIEIIRGITPEETTIEIIPEIRETILGIRFEVHPRSQPRPVLDKNQGPRLTGPGWLLERGW